MNSDVPSFSQYFTDKYRLIFDLQRWIQLNTNRLVYSLVYKLHQRLISIWIKCNSRQNSCTDAVHLY